MLPRPFYRHSDNYETLLYIRFNRLFIEVNRLIASALGQLKHFHAPTLGYNFAQVFGSTLFKPGPPALIDLVEDRVELASLVVQVLY